MQMASVASAASAASAASPEAEIVTFQFIDAKIPMNPGFVRHAEEASVNINPVVESAVSMIHTIFGDMLAGRIKPVHMYKWNLYEQLSAAATSPIIIPNLSILAHNIYAILNIRLRNAVHLPFEDCKFIDDKKQPLNLFMNVNITKSHIPEYAHVLAYKIHLVTLPDYILYTFCKLTLLRLFPYRVQTKMNFDSRTHLPTPHDTITLSDKMNGGAVATFVIYAGMNPNYMMLLLHSLHIIFKGEEHIIGGMTTLDAPTVGIPTFNVRLNQLIAYASGDRGKKLNARLHDNGFEVADPPPKGTFKKPDWIADMQAACSDRTKDEINKDALLWIGHELCDATGKALPDPTPCGICYMTSKEAEPMVTPHIFKTEMNRINNAARTASASTSASASYAASSSARKKRNSRTSRTSRRSRTQKQRRLRR
jgi:hypothetical protein